MRKDQFVKISISKDELVVVVQLSAILTKSEEGDDGSYVSYCPVLKICSQGKNITEAKSNIIEAVYLFIESCLERGVLNKSLKKRGFVTELNKAQKLRKTKPLKATGKEERIIKFPLELPFGVCNPGLGHIQNEH